jgi:iron complex transport system substrate-binding protein
VWPGLRAATAAWLLLVAAATAAAPPARRIVTLAPHLAELAWAAGAGDRLVGTVAWSDRPDAVRRLPRVGDAFRVDYEAIVALRPDLVLGWPSGNSAAALDRLRGLGLRVEALEPGTLDDVGRQIAAIGRLAGTEPTAAVAAAGWAAGLGALRERYRGAPPLRVFYQVSAQPLVTVTGTHFIGQAIALCGGRNVFADLPGLAPVVGREAVVAARPDVIVISALADGAAGDEAGWRRFDGVPAVARGNLPVVDPALMSVPGPRLLDGIAALCAALDAARR